MSNIYSIYKATNTITGQYYIGFDKKWPNRQKAHLKESRQKNNKQYWYDISKAIREYGWPNFTWEVIYQSNDMLHTLKIMEPHFIIHYQSKRPNGYNMTSGGEGFTGKHSKETLLLFSSQRTGKKHQIRPKRNIGKNNPSAKSVTFNNVTYDTYRECMLVTGLTKWYIKQYNKGVTFKPGSKGELIMHNYFGALQIS